MKAAFQYVLDKYFIKQPKLRRFVTRVLEGDQEVEVEILGARLRLNTIKEHGYLRAARLIGRSTLLRHEMPVIANLSNILRDGDTFIDVGANVGVYSLIFAKFKHLYPNISFYAFEANPDTFTRLNAQAQIAGVTAFNLALSDHEGVLEFVPGADSKIFTTIENISAWSFKSQRVNVPCQRLDKLAINGNSIILKVDVEGQEIEVLNGATGLFDAQRIKAVYVDGYKDNKVEEFLRSRGFSFYDGRTLTPITGNVFCLLALR